MDVDPNSPKSRDPGSETSDPHHGLSQGVQWIVVYQIPVDITWRREFVKNMPNSETCDYNSKQKVWSKHSTGSW